MQITYSDTLNASLDAPRLDPQFLLVANEYLAGNSIYDIASKLNIDPDVVTAICEKSETKRYIDTVVMAQGYLHRAKRLKLINKVIDSKLEEAEMTGVYSNKDLLEWIKLLGEIEKNATPKGPATAVQVNTTNNYATLLNDLLGE